MTPGERRWLFVDAASGFGGHEVMLLRWLDELLPERSPVPRLLAREGGRLLALAPEPVRLPGFRPERAGGRLQRWLGAWHDLQALRRALKQERPECVVFACGSLKNQIHLVLLARLLGARALVYVPLLDTFAAMGYRAAGLQDAFVRRFYARIPCGWVAITSRQADHFRAWARPSGPVFVLPNTVNRAIEAAPRLQPREVAPDERLRVLVLGRLDAHQKGLDLLLAQLERAPSAVLDGLLVCITGEGPYRGELEARCQADPALARCVVLGEWMPAAQAMAANDVLLMPSRFEGVPLVMLEAMALGLPVASSHLPGTAAYLPAACLFAVGDIAHALRILHALRSRAARERLAARGRSVYEAQASSAAFAQAVTALTRDVRRAFALDGLPAKRPLVAQAPGGNR